MIGRQGLEHLWLSTKFMVMQTPRRSLVASAACSHFNAFKMNCLGIGVAMLGRCDKELEKDWPRSQYHMEPYGTIWNHHPLARFVTPWGRSLVPSPIVLTLALSSIYGGFWLGLAMWVKVAGCKRIKSGRWHDIYFKWKKWWYPVLDSLGTWFTTIESLYLSLYHWKKHRNIFTKMISEQKKQPPDWILDECFRWFLDGGSQQNPTRIRIGWAFRRRNLAFFWASGAKLPEPPQLGFFSEASLGRYISFLEC